MKIASAEQGAGRYVVGKVGAFLNPLFLWGDVLFGYGRRGKADKFWMD